MRKLLLIALMFSLLVFGCLKIESNRPTPTPQIVYVSASPQIIVSVQPSYVPTVTEKVVFPSVTVQPARKGGIIDLGNERKYIQFDISKATNTDYHHNPYLMQNSIGKNYFPDLKEGNVAWRDIPFAILPDYATSGTWSVITTASENFFSTSFLTNRARLSELYLLATGVFRPGDRRALANIKINYEDGGTQERDIYSNEDVWNYVPDSEFPIPKERIGWQSPASDGSQILTVIYLNITRPNEQIGGIAIKKLAKADYGVSIFAVTGEKTYNLKKIVQTETEFQEEGWNRIYSTTLPSGAMINFIDQDGKRAYKPEATFESPILNGMTELADWKKIEWKADVPPSTSIKIQVREGKGDNFINGSWGDWFDVQNGGGIGNDAQYLQWRALFKTSDSTASPVLKEMQITYENPV